ncbi:MAG: hypothetical protein WC843_02765 [Candidatus Gracilibacteria bacterium]|jgi:hypothetical protein
MTKNCRQCGNAFEITDEDSKFYEKISPIFAGKKYQIPAPVFCPDCRMQRRLAFRNERKLYHRKCDLTGKEIISMYSPDKPVQVYGREAWWGDQWNPLDYGRDFDFNRPFFEQFAELLKVVPRIALINKEIENSEYCNFGFRNKNSYLLFTCGYCENSYYSNRSFKMKDCAECSNLNTGELCYELVDCENCYNSQYLQNSNNCSDCILGFNLKGCKNCFACCNLNNAEFYIENKKYSEEEYRKKLPELLKNFEASKALFNELKKQAIRKYINGVNLENCTGDALFNSKNSLNCYEGKNLQDCKFVCNATNMKDSYDVINDDNSELVYEAVGSESNYMHAFNDICWFDSFDYYNSLCFNSKNIFGCVGLKKNEYCILNKQYSKEDYEKLVPRIIEHMRKTDEWGQFFPMSISVFSYNETLAQDYFPLVPEQAKKIGANWKNEDLSGKYQGSKVIISKNIQETPNEITKQILVCDKCSKNYKIIPQELQLYRKINVPVPNICHECRHLERMEARNPRKLWERNCAKCGVAITTSYAPNRPEIVYCESCYLKEVY